MKSYQQICGIARALDIIGDRWTLLILRDLLLGPLHYNELLDNLRGITSNLLADRLRQLIDHGLIEKCDASSRSAYQLTEEGRSVEPILFALGKWGWSRLDIKDSKASRNLRWALVSVKRRLRPQGRNYILSLVSSDQGAYTIWEKGGQVHIEAGPAPAADLVLQGPALALLQALALSQPSPWTHSKITATGELNLWQHVLHGLEMLSQPRS